MKKVLTFGLLVLVGLWVTGVMFFGRAASSKVDDQIAEINTVLLEQTLPVSLNKHSYDSGFFSSQSRIQLNIDRENREALVVDVDLDIYHGPIMLTPDGLKLGAYYIAFTPDMTFLVDENKEAKEFLDSFGERRPLSGHFLLGLWGGQDIGLELAPFTFSNDGHSVSLENGVISTFSSDEDFSRLKSTVKFGALSFEDKNEALTVDIAPSTLTTDITEFYAGSMLTGELEYTLDNVITRSKGSESRIEGITLRSDNDKNDAGLYGNAHFIVKSIASDDENLKAMFSEPLNFRFDISYEGLNEQATREFSVINQTLNHQMYVALLSNKGVSSLEALNEQNFDTYMLAMAALVEQGLKFDYGFTLGKGDASAGVDIAFEWVDAEGLMAKKTFRQLLTACQVDLKASVDKAFFADTNLKDMAQIPVVSGYAVVTEQGIESHADFNRGELLLNGNPVPYLEQMGAALDTELPWAK